MSRVVSRVDSAWIGIDAGKTHHWVVVLDGQGRRLLSRRIANDEPAILELLDAVDALAVKTTWAIDVPDGNAGLILAVLWARGQSVLYVPGRVVNRAADSYRGEGKTDAKDARVIADQVRLRRDFAQLRADHSLIAELRLLIAHRRDLTTDRTRAITRLREQLTAVCPALERSFDFTRRGPLVLLTGYQTPSAIRRDGPAALIEQLRRRGVRNAKVLAAKAMEAASAQHVQVPGEALAAQVIAKLAEQALALERQIRQLDEAIGKRFARHQQAKVLVSLPGMGVLLGAEFLVATGGDLAAFASADRLAAYAGLAPVPRDSGKRTGNLHRPRRYNRSLLRVFYLSALSSLRACRLSRAYYQRKRSEGKHHIQALIALARRRLNVVWALLRDQRLFQPAAPSPQPA